MADEYFHRASHDDPKGIHDREQTLALALDKIRESDQFIVFSLQDGDMYCTGVIKENEFRDFGEALCNEGQMMLRRFYQLIFLQMLFGEDGDDD